MAKWPLNECQKAYKPLAMDKKQAKSPVANLATADEEDQDADESTIGSNTGTPFGYLKGCSVSEDPFREGKTTSDPFAGRQQVRGAGSAHAVRRVSEIHEEA